MGIDICNVCNYFANIAPEQIVQAIIKGDNMMAPFFLYPTYPFDWIFGDSEKKRKKRAKKKQKRAAKLQRQIEEEIQRRVALEMQAWKEEQRKLKE